MAAGEAAAEQDKQNKPSPEFESFKISITMPNVLIWEQNPR
jgi:hypothetical protein